MFRTHVIFKSELWTIKQVQKLKSGGRKSPSHGPYKIKTWSSGLPQLSSPLCNGCPSFKDAELVERSLTLMLHLSLFDHIITYHA